MLLLDDLLMLPVSGLGFILRTLERVAEQEYSDDQPVKERLLELQLKLEAAEISDEEYAKEEASILAELRAVQDRKRALAGAPPRPEERGLAFQGGAIKASVSVNFHQDHRNPKG